MTRTEPGPARRSLIDSLRDAERCLRLVIEQHQHHCNDYPECERCISMQVEAKNAASALDWLLKQVPALQPMPQFASVEHHTALCTRNCCCLACHKHCDCGKERSDTQHLASCKLGEPCQP